MDLGTDPRRWAMACAIAGVIFAGPIVAQQLESGQDYCENNQGYDVGSADYQHCYSSYTWAHCDGQGHTPDSEAHKACVQAMGG